MLNRTELEITAAVWSDMHKDTYGTRPRYAHGFITIADFEADMDRMAPVLAENTRHEQAMAVRAAEAFKALIKTVIAAGAQNEFEAIRWITDSESFDHSQDVESYIWNLGFLFTDFGKQMVEEICLENKIPYRVI